MGPKLGTALLLFIPLISLSLSLANAATEDDSKEDLADPSANQVGASQTGHVLVKREAGRGKSCEGKRCSKNKTLQKGKKGKKDNRNPKNNEKKRKTLRSKRLQRQKKKKKETKKKSKPGKKSKKRKGGKKKESPKKSLKGKKRGGSRRRGEGSSRSSTGRQITGNATSCAMKLVLYARLNEKKASSISKQIARIIGNDKIQGSKGKKSGDFNATMDRLLSALGGDPNNPKCDGTPISASNASGRAVHRNGSVAKETLETLQKCSADIAEKCGSPLTGNATKKAELEACAALADNFKSAFASCTSASKSIETACICIEAINSTEVEEMQKCDASSDNTDALARKKACKKAVGTCKTAEANAVEGIDSCKEQTKCGGAKDKEEAQRQLAALTPLNDALNRKEMDNAMASAGVASGPGADGTIPSTRIFARGSRNSTDGAGCVELAQLWGQFNTSANQAAGSANGDLDTGAANVTTSILNSINSRTTLVADLQSCSNGTTRISSSGGGRQIQTVITIIQIRIYIFWMGWWRETVISVKITIITSTFSIETTTASSTTTASGGTTASSAPSTSGGSTNGSIAPTTSGATSNGSSASAATTTVSGVESCRCGVKGSQRIVGGVEADVGEWPWIVVHSSGTRDNPVTDGSQQGGCGGTLVAENWVITAAHCFYDLSGNQVVFADTMSVVIGEHTLATDNNVLSDNDDNDSKRMNLEIETMIIHESYNPTEQTHDIALLKLKEKLDLNIYTPACLPDAGKDWAGSTGWVYGWGDTKSEDESSNTLRETSQLILTNAACEEGEGLVDTNGDGVDDEVSMAGTISADMLCAEAEGKDSCQGDSGGPFTVDVDGQHHLVGVVSWGFGCAKAGLPGVYSSVSAQREWVDQKISDNGGASFCSGSSSGSTGGSATSSGGSTAASAATTTTSGSSGSTPISLASTSASGGTGGLPSITPGPIETYARVMFRLFPGSGAPLETLNFDGVDLGLGSGSQLDSAKPLKVVIHGWGGSTLSNGQVQVEDDMARNYANTYEDAGIDVTVIGVHWVPVDGWEGKNVNASGDAANTVALLLYALAKDYGISPSATQVIGFSMGTVVSSKTGKRTQELGLPLIARLTLLDPCPAEEALVIELTDGLYVEAMHTSSQDICSTEPLAHVDFYPNGGLSQVCGVGSCSCSGSAAVCNSCYHGKPRCTGIWAWGENHGRAVELYRESIEATQGRGSTFLSWKCSISYPEMIASDESCSYDGASQLVPMGEDVLTNGRPADGIYFLTTNGEEPRSYNSYEQWTEN